MPEVEKKSDWFLWLIGISCVIAVASTFYFFYFQKDYNFIVEVPCDISTETCFVRDCSEGYCPPNELSEFKRYSLNAGDFAKCENEDCANACEIGTIQCELLECEEDEAYGEYCVSPEIDEFEETLIEEPTEEPTEEILEKQE